MKIRYKRSLSIAMFAFVLISMLFANQSTISAASYTFLEKTGSSALGEGKQYTFKVDRACTLNFSMLASNVIEGSMYIYDTKDREVFHQAYSASEWNHVGEYYLHVGSIEHFKAGTYTVHYNFMSTVGYYEASIYRKNKAEFKEPSVEITKGFSKKLTVLDGTASSWTTSDSTVATVSSTGKVTGKKSGSCTITATVGSEKLPCQVTVVDNVYEKAPQKTVHSRLNYEVTKVSYDSKGNIVAKVRVTNRTLKNIKYLRRTKLTLKTSANKVIGTYSSYERSFPIKKNSTKTMTITIKKKDLKIKKADLYNMKKPSITIKSGTK